MAQADNAFRILGLPERFDLDAGSIEENWRRAIALVHPDRFADKSAAERRVAEQWAGRINEAREALIDPVRRAQMLLAAAGVDVGAESDTRMPPDFLLEQMSWREELEEGCGEPERLAQLAGRVEASRSALIEELTQAIDCRRDWESARNAVRRLMFVEKFRRELERGMHADGPGAQPL